MKDSSTIRSPPGPPTMKRLEEDRAAPAQRRPDAGRARVPRPRHVSCIGTAPASPVRGSGPSRATAPRPPGPARGLGALGPRAWDAAGPTQPGAQEALPAARALSLPPRTAGGLWRLPEQGQRVPGGEPQAAAPRPPPGFPGLHPSGAPAPGRRRSGSGFRGSQAEPACDPGRRVRGSSAVRPAGMENQPLLMGGGGPGRGTPVLKAPL